MTRAFARITRGMGAAVLLFALLVGVPAFLAIAVGWPLPRVLPAWRDVTATFGGDAPLDPDTVWKVLACVVWVAWAQVLAAALVEGSALARGGVAHPIRGLAHMQGLTGPLLSAVALVLPSSFAHPASNTFAPPPSLARELVAQVEDASPPATASPATPSASTSATPPAIEHTVGRRDTLWDLAERYLAPGGSVEEIAAGVQQIYDLNVGRPQADGGTLSDASLIRPGWVLHIPRTVASSEAASAAASVTVAPGDSLWEIAEDHLGDGHRYRGLYDLNVGHRQADGHALTDPSLIRPGWVIELPADAAAPPTNAPPRQPPATQPAPPAAEVPPAAAPTTAATPTSAAPDTPSTSAPRAPEPAQHEAPAASDVHDDGAAPIGALGAAGGFLSAGLAAAFTLRRRRQRVQRRPGTELAPLSPDAEPILDAIGDADIDLTEAVEVTLRQLAGAVAERQPAAVPVVATLDGPNLELLLDRDDPDSPDGWTAVAGGRIWRTQPAGRTEQSGQGPAWLPTFVSIGALDAGGLLLNLEAVGVVGITGESAAASALAASIAVELGVTPLADLRSVHVVGDALGHGRIADLPGIRQHPDLAAALAAAEQETAAIPDAISLTGSRTVFELRCQSVEEAWQPAVVVAAASDAGDESMQRLLQRCGTRTGVAAVVVGGCPGGALELAVTDDEVTITALGLRCKPQQLGAPSVDAIAAFFDAAEAPCEPPVEDSGPLVLFSDDENEGDAEPTEPTVHLRLLGPIIVEGVDLRPQQLALVTFLALHPNATADAVRDAVWGGRSPTRERFLNTIHELRRAVGADVLPTSMDGRYRLRRVWCDVAEVERLLVSASAQPDDATVDLRVALELVAGPPLTFESRHRRHFRWVDIGNHASRWERIITDAAHDLASIALGTDDVDLARWAAERGLVASPANETLTCDLVAAHLAAGDRKAAEGVAEAYARVLEDLGMDDSADAVHELLEPRRAS